MYNGYNGSGNGYGYTPNQLGVRPAAALSTAFLSQAFLWMFLGLGLSALTAWMAMSNPDVRASVVNLWLPVLIVQMVLGLGIQMGIRALNATVALMLFLVYAATMGLALGFVVYANVAISGVGTVAAAFVSSAAMFAGAGLYGVVTKRSLASLNGYIVMATWGLLVAFIVNFFLRSTQFDFILSAIGVVLFTILTATETNRIANGDYAAYTGSMEKASVFGALRLYLAFVNLFLMMLRLMGGGRQR